MKSENDGRGSENEQISDRSVCCLLLVGVLCACAVGVGCTIEFI